MLQIHVIYLKNLGTVYHRHGKNLEIHIEPPNHTCQWRIAPIVLAKLIFKIYSLSDLSIFFFIIFRYFLLCTMAPLGFLCYGESFFMDKYDPNQAEECC